METPVPLNAEQAAVENQRRAQEGLAHLDALEKDEHFKWFVEHVLEHARDEECDKALSVSLSREQAEQARWQHHAIARVCEAPKRLRAMYGKFTGGG